MFLDVNLKNYIPQMMFWPAVCLAQKSLGYHRKTHCPQQSCKSFNIKFNPFFKIEYKWSYKS